MTSGTHRFTIIPQGPFSLEESAMFGFGQRHATTFDGTMRLAFCVDGDGYSCQVGVAVSQDAAGAVHGEVTGEADLETVRTQVARVLSLDHDGREFVKIGERDPVMARLLAAAPGLRPPLFYSPYEAAIWSVLSARRPAGQMALVRDRLGEAHGRVFDVAGERMAALPTPQQMLGVASFEGIPEVKLRRMHGVAEAALRGDLDVERIRAMEPEEAMRDLQRLDGIGPFYSALIDIRATGHADVLPENEPQALALAGRLYGLGHDASPVEMREIAERWRPFRTWATVLLRAASSRIGESSTGGRYHLAGRSSEMPLAAEHGQDLMGDEG
ncbi:MAG: DNA-3-methyladenine glycosylase 2 family protein [Chloroflexi bacterium]|nr:DNA-3-methyladenine glycosylase 2 family protein [Chloroflexota bacterium]